MANAYIPRPISSAILNDRHKVVIVEGARAVGKTMLAKQQLTSAGYEYVSLADDDVYRYASSSPASWFKSLPKRVIIDEAQRVKELPLLVKEAVDQSTAQGPQYILTGSASIGKSSLDGQDPLIRRAARFTVNPLTQREAARIPGNVVDDLWQGKVSESFKGSCSREEIALRMSVGGFPQYVADASIMTASERSLSIRADISNILGSDVIPGERLDSSIADAVLQSLLSLPGNILNINRLAGAINRDSRTITSYVSVLVNRFLITPLRNQKLAAAKQSFTRAKIHPVDPSFSIEAFKRGGKDALADPVLFGYVLESFVASQILPAIEWSAIHPDSFFWREAGTAPKEVDLVLVHNNEMVGVEVKASSSVDHGDFKNLRSLAKRENLKRGFVVYTGENVVRESENMWAIPIDALWREGAFENNVATQSNIKASARSLMKITSETPGRSYSDMPSAANLFLSYNHADNDHLDNGIVQFVEKVIEEYEFSYGDSLSLFVDTRSIKWGEDWQKALDRAVDATNFLMPAVTPRYVRSAACRDELFKFYQRIEDNANSHILSMVWQPIDGLNLDASGKKAHEIIKTHQYVQVNDLRDLPSSDPTYKAAVRKAANMLHEVVIAQSSNPSTPKETRNDRKESEGLLELIDSANEGIALLQPAISEALSSVDAIAGTINEHPAPSSPKPGVFSAWGAEIAKAAQKDVDRLNGNLDDLEASWLAVRKFISSYFALAQTFDSEGGDALLTSLVQLRRTLALPEGIDALADQMQMLQMLSPKLKPMSVAMERLINIVKGLVASIDEMIDEGMR